MMTSAIWVVGSRRWRWGLRTLCSPVLGSRVASLSVLINARFASRDAGFILKLPPTKNWRVMVLYVVVRRWERRGDGRESYPVRVRRNLGCTDGSDITSATAIPTFSHTDLLTGTWRLSLSARAGGLADKFLPTMSIILLLRCLTQLGSHSSIGNAANVIVFPYGEWWAFRVIYHLVTVIHRQLS
jgi:hypothetical protein